MIRLSHTIVAGALVLLGSIAVVHGDPGMPDAGECAAEKSIERTLGRHGYRVVVAGGYKDEGDDSVKVQVWENEDRDWAITEAFLHEKRTCVVRSGIRLHMMY